MGIGIIQSCSVILGNREGTQAMGCTCSELRRKRIVCFSGVLEVEIDSTCFMAVSFLSGISFLSVLIETGEIGQCPHGHVFYILGLWVLSPV